jgi:hypothetical protein
MGLRPEAQPGDTASLDLHVGLAGGVGEAAEDNRELSAVPLNAGCDNEAARRARGSPAPPQRVL